MEREPRLRQGHSSQSHQQQEHQLYALLLIGLMSPAGLQFSEMCRQLQLLC